VNNKLDPIRQIQYQENENADHIYFSVKDKKQISKSLAKIVGGHHIFRNASFQVKIC